MSERIKSLFSSISNTKPFVWLVVIGFLVASIFLLFNANRQNANNIVTVVDEQQTKPTLVKNFDSDINLIKVSDTPALAGQLYFFGDNAETNPIFISQSAYFVETGSVLQSKKLFVPDTVYDLGNNNLLVNQDKESYKLDNTDGNSILLANNIFSITPLNNKYFFIQNRENEYVIKRSDQLILSDPETILSINKNEIGNPDFLQIRLFNDVPYLWTSTINSQNSSDIAVYRFGKTLDKKLDFTNVISSKYGYNKMMISSLDSAKLINSQLVDFGNPDKPLLSSIDFRQELGQSAKGKVSAQRCAIANGENKLMCLVKQDAAAYFDESKKDVFVEYDLDTQTTKILYEGFNISASSIFYSPSNAIFIIGQENGLIYKIGEK